MSSNNGIESIEGCATADSTLAELAQATDVDHPGGVVGVIPSTDDATGKGADREEGRDGEQPREHDRSGDDGAAHERGDRVTEGRVVALDLSGPGIEEESRGDDGRGPEPVEAAGANAPVDAPTEPLDGANLTIKESEAEIPGLGDHPTVAADPAEAAQDPDANRHMIPTALSGDVEHTPTPSPGGSVPGEPSTTTSPSDDGEANRARTDGEAKSATAAGPEAASKEAAKSKGGRSKPKAPASRKPLPRKPRAPASKTSSRAGDPEETKLVEEIKREQVKIGKSEGEAVPIIIGIASLLVTLKSRSKRTWTRHIQTLGYSPRVASRLLKIGKTWGGENGRIASDLLAKLTVDLNKLEWLCRLDPEQLRAVLDAIDCRSASRTAVIAAVRAALGETPAARTPRADDPLKSIERDFDRLDERLGRQKAAAVDAGLEREFHASLTNGIARLQSTLEAQAGDPGHGNAGT